MIIMFGFLYTGLDRICHTFELATYIHEKQITT